MTSRYPFGHGPSMPPTLHRQHPQRDFVRNTDPTEPFPEGVVTNPEACWFQHPDESNRRFQKYYNPAVRWGDRRVVQFAPNAAGPSVTTATQFTLDFKFGYTQPAVMQLRLSAVELTGALIAPSANDTVRFQVFIGTGAALQQKQFFLEVAPFDGTVQTDINLILPAQMLRVAANVTVVNNVPQHVIEVVTQCAPYYGEGAMVGR